MPMCKYLLTVSSPAVLTGTTASINNNPIRIKRKSSRKYAAKNIKAEVDGNGKIELDLHVRGRKDSGVTIKMKNLTTKKEIFSESGVIGSQSGSRPTEYNIKDKKINAKCE